MGKPTGKTYSMKLVSDMLKIPEDRFDEFLVQLKKWHSFGRTLTSFVETVHEVVGEKLPEEFMTIRWIDDGITEGMPTVKFTKPVAGQDTKEES